jgi:hypothetical protein
VTTYVLIPGACHGGWCFDDLAEALRSRGQHVPTYWPGRRDVVPEKTATRFSSGLAIA